MKRAVLLVLFLLGTVSVTSAGVIQEERSLLAQLKAYNAEYDQLTAKRAKFAKRASDLRWANDQLEKQIRVYNTKRTDLNGRVDLHLKAIRDHDSRCAGTFDDQGYVDACNSEAHQLNAITRTQKEENDSLNHTRDLLQTAIQTQNEEVDKTVVADKSAMDRQDVIANLARPIVERLKALASSNDLCQEAIAAVDADPTSMVKKEKMHAVCGAMFDGNK